MILVDTNVWIDFFQGSSRSAALAEILLDEKVVCHPWIVGELILGTLGKRRVEIISDLRRLPLLSIYSISELTDFIESEKLFSSGLSLVDVQLLYASLIEDHSLWTHDLKLKRAAIRFGKAWSEL